MWVQYYETEPEWRKAEKAVKDHCTILCQWADSVAQEVRAFARKSSEPKHEVAARPPPSTTAIHVTHTSEPAPKRGHHQPPATEGALTPTAQQLLEVTAGLGPGLMFFRRVLTRVLTRRTLSIVLWSR